jgi:hypothetical protein
MFGVVVKNTILFTLFILIMHFVLKTRLIEEGFTISSSVKDEVRRFEGFSGYSNGRRSRANDDIMRVIQSVAASDESILPSTQTMNQSQLQDLYAYVFNEDASKELNGYFETSKEEKGHDRRAGVTTCQPSLANATKELCATTIDKHFDIHAKTPIMETNHSFYKVYANENVMNGGLMDNIQGYGQIKDDYEQLY